MRRPVCREEWAEWAAGWITKISKIGRHKTVRLYVYGVSEREMNSSLLDPTISLQRGLPAALRSTSLLKRKHPICGVCQEAWPTFNPILVSGKPMGRAGNRPQ
jgi:hypothetical protein